MSFDEFRDEVKEALAQRIQNTEIKDVMVNKLQGESYRGITLKGNDSMICCRKKPNRKRKNLSEKNCRKSAGNRQILQARK